MCMKFRYFLILTIGFLVSATSAQEAVKGKVIPGFGPTYPIEDPEFKTELSEAYKVVFDISKAPENPAQINKYIEGVARFLNMHHEAGKPMNTISVYVVVHGEAANSLLKNEFYKEIYQQKNPNIGLLEALSQNNVEILLCGQTAVHRNITKERRIPETSLALSAMTALIQLQNDGYRLISF